MLQTIILGGDRSNLLPIAQGRIAIESALSFSAGYADHTTEPIFVDCHGGPTTKVVRSRGWAVTPITLDQFEGIPDAIAQACAITKASRVLVLFASQVYDYLAAPPIGARNVASTRMSDDRKLVGLARDRWETNPNSLCPRFAGWLVLERAVALQGNSRQRLASFLNDQRILSFPTEDAWWVLDAAGYADYIDAEMLVRTS